MQYLLLRRTWVAAITSLALTGGLLVQEINAQKGPADEDDTFPLLKQLRERAAEVIRQAEMPENPKSAYGEQARLTGNVVKSYVNSKEYAPEIVLRELSREPFPDRYGYLRNHFIYVYLENRDVDGLTRLLAVNCPEGRMGLAESIESVLAHWPAEATKAQGVLVLCNAWKMSKSKENRKRLITALRRGLEPMGIIAKDDADYVNQVRKWLAENREAFEPNPDYRFKYKMLALQGKQIPLFVPAGSAKKWDGKTVQPPR